MIKQTTFKDKETPIFKSYKEKQYFFRTLKRSFMRSEIDSSQKGIRRTVTNRFLAGTYDSIDSINMLFPYYEYKLTNNK